MSDSSATLELAPERSGARSRAGAAAAERRHARKRGSRVVAWRHGPRDAAVHRLLAIADLAGIALSLALVIWLFGKQSDQFLWGLATLPLWVVLFKAYGLYDRDVKRISHGTVDELPYLFHSVLLGSLLLFAYFRLAPPADIDLGNLFLFAAAAIVVVAAFRALARRSAVTTLGPERALLIGDGEQIETLARKMRAHREYGIEPVEEIYRLSSSGTGLAGDGAQSLDLAGVIARHDIERVVVAHEEFEEDALVEVLRRSRELGVNVSVLPRFFDALGPSVEVDDVEGITVLGVSPPVLHPSSRFLKRSMDLFGSIVLLTLAAPLLALIAIAIRIDSRGPILFRQERVGRGGRRFRLAKFRTMVPDAEQQREELLAESKDPNWLHLEDDPRVTRIGRLLRSSSLDELPQLWNVLKGEMSLVGPRPIVEAEDRQLEGWRRSRIDLTPGVTGLWQVLGRTNISFEEMIKLDYLYVTNWSLWTDVRLILRTFPAVVLGRGAN